jgi:hypothetical protein
VPIPFPDLLGFVHVPSFAADEGLIYFDFATGAAQLNERACLHGASDAVEHEPRRLLSDSKRTSNLATGNTIASVNDHPESRHPLIQAERRILKDRSNLDGELLVAPTAEPEPPRLDEVVFVRVAPRADDLPIGPAEFHCVIEGAVRIGEVNNGFL